MEAAVLDELLVNDTAAEDFHPLAVEEDLELEGGIREGEVLVNPAELDLAEQGRAHAWGSERRTRKKEEDEEGEGEGRGGEGGEE